MVAGGSHRPATAINLPKGTTVNLKRRALTRAGSIAAIALAGTMILSSCAANEAPAAGDTGTTSKLSGTLNGIGSSAQGAAEIAWGADFQKANPDVTVNYDPIGSGDGRKNFISEAYSFAGTDSALIARSWQLEPRRTREIEPV